ncbi:hypothetical protein LEP1GSC132_2287 [Leptospira kirschneri str. 200803703]|nr:hypothetical protein LEP1GSC132_2287 [Leptospira kirschneri str. 200803703]
MGESGFTGPRSLAPVNQLHKKNVIYYFVLSYNIEHGFIKSVLQSLSHWILSNSHKIALVMNISDSI